jgi:pyridoxal phosphate enzyme (YggS family)
VAVSEDLAIAVRARLAAVRDRIAIACRHAARPAGAARLIAVSKGHPQEAIRAGYAAGQRDFGESYVQELKQKVSALADLSELRFRFIGRLQRNKVKEVAALGCAVDSIDSLALATALSQRALAFERTLEVLVQVNVDSEPQKAGVLPERLPELLDAIRVLPNLSLRGLMAIPRTSADPEQVRQSFVELRMLAQRFGLPELSMGMSADLELAIEEGATMLRVGTAIFGPRG